MTDLFDVTGLRRLVGELRRTMHGLLVDLCRDLQREPREAAGPLTLPAGLVRLLGRTLPREAYSTWKVVGWIEELNDLVYFLDVRRQLAREADGNAASAFASAFLDECEAQLYEHHYLEDLFPSGKAEPSRLAGRLDALCGRLARRLAQEAATFEPRLPCAWLRSIRRAAWSVPCDVSGDVERAERRGCLSIGLEGAQLVPPPAVRAALARRGFRGTLLFSTRRVRLRVGRRVSTVPVPGEALPAGWRLVTPSWVRPPAGDGFGGLAVGPTLVYDRRRRPSRLTRTDPRIVVRVARALAVIDRAWPLGAALLATLTARVVPLRAPGVVSYSYRHRPGLSFINCFDRDEFDLLDDLIHENSHHHLNLLLRKYRLHRGDGNEERWYSPWRRSLRPLRGILHATFTFTMGLLLFERLSTWYARQERAGSGRPVPCKGFDGRHALRARFRGLEEAASLRYALQDLQGPASRHGWLTPAGRHLVAELARQVALATRRLAPYREAVERSRYGVLLRRHLRELEAARRRYRPGRRLTA